MMDPSGDETERRRALLARLMAKKTTAGKVAPMSFAQQRLWFFDQLAGATSLYNLSHPVRLRFSMDVAVLRRVLQEIVRRHEALRTTFGISGGTPVQMVSATPEIVLPVEDLAGREHDAQRIATDDYLAPFDLRNGPLFRFRLLRLADDDHILLVSMHHIVSDGWSLSLLLAELDILYAAFAAGQPSPYPELPIQYADYAAWQKEQLAGPLRDVQLGYWKKRLEGLSALELPADRLRPPVPSFLGRSVPLRIDPGAVAALRQLGKEQNATPFIVFLAVFDVLLCCYSGQEDIVVGSPVAGRGRGETEALIGFFVNSLVLRTNLAGDPTFREAVDRVRDTVLGAFAHQDLPFEMLVEELHPERVPARNPLFQVMFQLLNNTKIPENESSGGSAMPTLRTGTAKFDLSLMLYEWNGDVGGMIEFSRDLFDEARIERMAGHYAALVDSIAAGPDLQISELEILTTAEQQRSLGNQFVTSARFPRDRGILEAFAQNVADRPDAVAVREGGAVLSYADLDTRACRLAAYLRAHGGAPGAVVAIQLPRSAELIVAALAVLKSGAAYLPVDPEIPGERLDVILAESHATALVSRDATPRSIPVVAPDAGKDGAVPGNPYNEEDLAYVIFTSGSTGTPKGVQIPHRGLANLIAWHNRTFDVAPSSRATQFAAPGFDAAVWEIWPYLAAGASVEIVPDDVRYTPARFPEWLATHRITHCFVPTPLVDGLVRQVWPRPLSLRFLLTGGDRLVRGVPSGLPFRVFNNYGPTENSVVTTSGEVAEQRADGAAPSIGRPVANVELLVVNRHGRPLPEGIPGELWIGGTGLFRGYINAPNGLTRHPLRPLEKVYRSGDVVRYRSDGEVEFLGRLDDQVKIRGFRIEPGEIEAVLAGCVGVEQVCVVATVDCEPRLVAYVTGTGIDSERIRAHAGAILPAYMVPSAFVELEAFPLTANGKIDRARLPAPPQDRDPACYTAPRTRTEEAIAAIWHKELKIARAGIDENFFDSGGSSLTLIGIHFRLEELWPGRLSVIDLFRHPTIRALAAFIDNREQGQSPVEKARDRGLRRKESQR